MTEGPLNNICANLVLAPCCGGSVPGRLKTGAHLSSKDWECLSSERSMNYCVCVFTQDVQGQNSIQIISNRQEKFIRYKLAIFHDTLTLSYSRIQLYSLFLEIIYVLAGSCRLDNFADLCPGYVGSIKETQKTHCLSCFPSGPEGPQLLVFNFFGVILYLLCSIFFSRGSSQSRDQTRVSHIAGILFTV